MARFFPGSSLPVTEYSRIVGSSYFFLTWDFSKGNLCTWAPVGLADQSCSGMKITQLSNLHWSLKAFSPYSTPTPSSFFIGIFHDEKFLTFLTSSWVCFSENLTWHTSMFVFVFVCLNIFKSYRCVFMVLKKQRKVQNVLILFFF